MERNRVLVLAGLLAVFAGAILVRLVNLQLLGHTFWEVEGVKARSRARRLAAPRGALLDRNGEPLAVNEGIYGVQFVYTDYRRHAPLGQLQMALYLLTGRRSRLGDLVQSPEASLERLSALEAGTILSIQPRQRSADLCFYLEHLAGPGESRLEPRLRDVPAETPLEQVIEKFRARTAERVQASIRSLRTIERLLGDSTRGEAGLVTVLDEAVASIDRQVSAHTQRGTYAEQRALHRDYDMRDGAWQRKRVSYAMVEELGYRPDRYPGFEILDRARRIYPSPWRDLFPGLIGFVGATTEADVAATEQHRRELERLREKPTRSLQEYDRMLKLEVLLEEIDYLPGEERGSLGLEALYEPLLRGKRGWRKVVRNWESGVRHIVEEKPPIPGRDVTLTIDARVQAAVQDLLARAPSVLRDEFSGIGLAIIRLPEGEVLALGSRPAVTRDAYRNAWVNEIQAEREARQAGRFWPGGAVFHRAYNPCTPPPPGSVFKPFVALAALKAGLLDTDFAPFCDGGVGLGNARVRCLGHHGAIGLEQALVKSCNAYFAETARNLGYEPIRRAAEAFGLGQVSGFAWARLYPDRAGTVALTSSGRPRFTEPACAISGPTRSLRSLRLFGCGQGWIDDTTPLQMARAMGGLALGRLPEVHIVKSVEGMTLRPPQARPLPFDEADLARVRHSLERVVRPGGTAHPHDGHDLRRWRVAAKSGSATHGGLKRNGKYLHHAWLAGYLPADAPRLAFAVVVELTLQGGGSAGVALLDALFDDPRLADYLGEPRQ